VAAPATAVFEQLVACYSEPHRRYHTIQHLDECFAKFEELRSEANHPEEIEFALWFHDAIYDTRRADNEARSAAWARATAGAAKLPAAVADRIHSLIMATRHDVRPHEADEKVMVDVDLSILGASPARFDEYESQVREEYSWVPAALFRSKRRELLEGFLRRASIFNTRTFVEAYEAQARANLERSIRQLGR
jgi:predicted metal-dependent HD superfamily phosphohydrolase